MFCASEQHVDTDPYRLMGLRRSLLLSVPFVIPQQICMNHASFYLAHLVVIYPTILAIPHSPLAHLLELISVHYRSIVCGLCH